MILVVLALGAIWWVEKHPDLDVGYGLLIFGVSWMTALTGIYWTLKKYWL